MCGVGVGHDTSARHYHEVNCYRNLCKNSLHRGSVQTTVSEASGYWHASGQPPICHCLTQISVPRTEPECSHGTLMAPQCRIWSPGLGHHLPISGQGWECPLGQAFSSISVSGRGNKVLLPGGKLAGITSNVGLWVAPFGTGLLVV